LRDPLSASWRKAFAARGTLPTLCPPAVLWRLVTPAEGLFSASDIGCQLPSKFTPRRASRAEDPARSTTCRGSSFHSSRPTAPILGVTKNHSPCCGSDSGPLYELVVLSNSHKEHLDGAFVPAESIFLGRLGSSISLFPLSTPRSTARSPRFSRIVWLNPEQHCLFATPAFSWRVADMLPGGIQFSTERPNDCL